jgi:hypothetical protein
MLVAARRLQPVSKGAHPVDDTEHSLRYGALIEWSDGGFGGWTLANASGKRFTVDGHPAKEAVFVPAHGACVIGTAREVTVFVPRAAKYNYYEMRACLRGPDLTQERAEVQSMIASTKIL